MFERFTHGARELVRAAGDEAAALGHDHIGGAHLLLAAMAPQAPTRPVLAGLGLERQRLRAAVRQVSAPGDADALATLGIDLEEVRRRVEETFGAGALESTRAARRGRRIPFTPAAKHALEHALREAVTLRHRRIEAGHVVLGLAGVGDPVADAALRRVGVSREAIHEAMLAALQRPDAAAG